MDEPKEPNRTERAAERMGCLLGFLDMAIRALGLPVGLGLVVGAVCMSIHPMGEGPPIGFVGGVLMGLAIQRLWVRPNPPPHE
jgi:hypothetical protein